MSREAIEVDKTPAGVALVWLNRPDVRNAFNDTMIGELTAAFRELDGDASVRAVVLAGRGPAFCAGADLNWMKKMADYSFAQNYDDALGLATMLHTLHTLGKPTIARVHGPAFAGGIGLVAACDIAVADQAAEFCLSEAKLGLIPATIAPYVIAAMGERLAYRYMLTAERFTAAEAYRIGLVQEITVTEELDPTINEILGHLVLGGPAAQTATKDLIRAVAGQRLGPDLIKDTATRIAAARASEEGKEGIRSFLEKRKPAWVAASSRAEGAAAKTAGRPRKRSG
jgi:methylglutaconyl-CoA hydratase